MTRRLAALADFTYRRRGTVVLAWIAVMIVTIGLGSALAGEYNANYDTPGSESKAASDLTESRFDGYSGQEIYVAWKDEAGADTPAARRQVELLHRRGDAGRPHRASRRRCGSRRTGRSGRRPSR